MDTTLQRIVDDLAGELGRPVSIEDRRWRLLAFSAHTSDADDVRRDSILARSAPPAVATWLTSLGIERATGTVQIAAHEPLGIGPRVCAPMRFDGVLLGYLWLIPGSDPLDSAQLETVSASAERAAKVIWHQRSTTAQERSRASALLADLLGGGSLDQRREAARALQHHQGWNDAGRLAVAVSDRGSADPRDVANRALRIDPNLGLVEHGTSEQAVYLAQLPVPSTSRDVAGLLCRSGASRVVAAPVSTLAAVATPLDDADLGLLAIRAVPELGPASSTDHLGSWLAIARLWRASGYPATAPVELEPLLARPDGDALIRVLEVVLEHVGDIAAAAEALHLHRATVYRRLERITALTGLRLRHGDDVLRAHIAVRTWRLAAQAPGNREQPSHRAGVPA